MTTPTFGSMVQNGKLAASALALESELKSVLLPTFGRPTMPQEKPMGCASIASGRTFGNVPGWSGALGLGREARESPEHGRGGGRVLRDEAIRVDALRRECPAP